MAISEIFDCLIGAFCGACKNNIPCEDSLGATLRANGLADTEENRSVLRGLSYHASNYGMGYSFQYSDFGKALSKLIKERHHE